MNNMKMIGNKHSNSICVVKGEDRVGLSKINYNPTNLSFDIANHREYTASEYDEHSEIISFGGINIYDYGVPRDYISERDPIDTNSYLKHKVVSDDITIDFNSNKEYRNGLCPVCCVTFFDYSQLYRFACGHSFCKSCIEYYFTTSINENKLENVKCLNHLCSQKVTNEELVENEILSKELINKKLQFEKKNEIMNDESKAPCPYPDCDDYAVKGVDYIGMEMRRENFPSTFNINRKTTDVTDTLRRSIFASTIQNNVRFEDNLEASTGNKGIELQVVEEGEKNAENFLICQKGHKFCKECKQLFWHFNTPCVKEERDFLIFMQENQKELKNCPQCGIWTEKALGCNHIKCSGCLCHWCWICLGPYTEDHYSNPSSPCKGKMFLGVNTEYLQNLANNGGNNVVHFQQDDEIRNEWRNILIERRLRNRYEGFNYRVEIGCGEIKYQATYYDNCLARFLYALALLILFLLINFPIAKGVYTYLKKKLAFRNDAEYRNTTLKRYNILVYLITFQVAMAFYFCGVIITLIMFTFPLLKYSFLGR